MSPDELLWRVTVTRERLQQICGDLRVIADALKNDHAICRTENAIAALARAVHELRPVPTLENPEPVIRGSIRLVESRKVCEEVGKNGK